MKIDIAFDNARKFAQDFANDPDSLQGLEVSSKSPLLKLNDEWAHNFYNGDDPKAAEHWIDLEKLFPKPKPKKKINGRAVETSWKNTNPPRQEVVKYHDERMKVLDAAAENYQSWVEGGEDEDYPFDLFNGIERNEQRLYANELAFVKAAIKEGIFKPEDFTEMD